MLMKNCVICGKPAIMWTGHVHTEKGTVTAGHCQEHYETVGTEQMKGCDSSNPQSCFGWRELNVDFTMESDDESYLTTVNGKLEVVKREDYSKTDEARIRRGEKL